METPVSTKVVYNPLSKITIQSSSVPVCQYWSDTQGEDPIQWRNSMVETYGDEIIANHGELSVADNGDIFISRHSEELYSPDLTQNWTNKDWYFMNMSLTEFDLMSDYEFQNHNLRQQEQILRRYMTAEQRNLAFTDVNAYLTLLQQISDNTATVVQSVEATLYDWLKQAWGDGLKMIDSTLIMNIFQTIHIKQLSISAYTDLRTWMYGVAKNFFPFVFFKDTGIYDMCNTTGTAPSRLSQISYGSYSPSPNAPMEIYYKEISSSKKNLMTVCKWTNTNYQPCPEGQFKAYVYDDPQQRTLIGDVNTIFDGLNIEIVRQGEYTEYNVTVNDQVATSRLTDWWQQYIEETQYITDTVLGIQSYKDTTSKSIFMTDFGVTVPSTKLMVQNQQTFKFTEGEKFVVYYAFKKYIPDGQKQFSTAASDYFLPVGVAGAQVGNVTVTIPVRLANLEYVGTSKVWTTNVYENVTNTSNQPFIGNDNFRNGEIYWLNKEVQQKQEFSYDETYINDGFVKGDFYYMTGVKQTKSSGFIGIQCKVQIWLPSTVSYNQNTQEITYFTAPKIIDLRSVMAVEDLNNVYQIKDTINETRFNMMSKLYQDLDMFVRTRLEIISEGDAQSQQTIDAMDQNLKTLIFYTAMYMCTQDVDWYTNQVFFKDVIPPQANTIHAMFPRTFTVMDETIDYFSNINDIVESKYAYETKTFTLSRTQNQSYTVNNKVQYSPVPLPFDVRDFTLSNPVIYFNALVPTIDSGYEMGGGMIAKKQYHIMEDVFIKYIVTKSPDFVTGLSNSEIVRFDVQTFDTDGLDNLYQSAFPNTKKEIGLTFKRMTQSLEDAAQQSMYLNNKIITNMTYEHNQLSQSDTIKMALTIYDQEK